MQTASDVLRVLRRRAATYLSAPCEPLAESVREWVDTGEGEPGQDVLRLLELLMQARGEGERAGIEACQAFDRSAEAEVVALKMVEMMKRGTLR